MFTEKSLWTSENVGYLVKYFAENLDEGEGSFFEKLEKQLARAPGTAKQLAAEMFWVMYLFPRTKLNAARDEAPTDSPSLGMVGRAAGPTLPSN